MKELIMDAVALGYAPLFYTKRGTINSMAKKLEGITVERCKPLELSHLQQWLREEKGIVLAIHYTDGVSEYYWSYWNLINNKGLVGGTNSKTYEEALVGGIKEAINLVEN